MLRLMLRGASALAGGSRPKLVAGLAEEARQGPGEEGLVGGQTSSRRGRGAASPPLSALPALHTASPSAVGLQHPCCCVCTSTGCGDGGAHSALATMELPAWSSILDRPHFWRGGSGPGWAGGRFVESPGPDSQRAGGKSLCIGILIPGRLSEG